jgi:hypothetical protein
MAHLRLPRLIAAGFAAGGWVFVSGLLMAAAFGFRDMKAAFDAVGLPFRAGAGPFVVHTVVRFLVGMTVVALYVLLTRGFPPTQALLAAVFFVWLLGTVLPFAVVVEWGIFPWFLALKLYAWNAVEILIAAVLGKWIYGG